MKTPVAIRRSRRASSFSNPFDVSASEHTPSDRTFVGAAAWEESSNEAIEPAEALVRDEREKN
jgi:hypothetical protein